MAMRWANAKNGELKSIPLVESLLRPPSDPSSRKPYISASGPALGWDLCRHLGDPDATFASPAVTLPSLSLASQRAACA
jgi:hypothetical protein